MAADQRKGSGSVLPGIVGETEALEIVSAVGKPLTNGVSPSRLAAAVNHVVTESAISSHDLPTALKHAQLSAYRAAFLELMKQCKRTMPKHDLFPPKPEAEWVKNTLEWIAENELLLGLNKPSIGGRPPSIPPRFFRLSLGLYHAAFNAKPAYSYAGGTGQFGPTGRFVLACLNATLGSNEELKVYNSFFVDSGSRDQWTLIGDSSLRNKLKFHCRETRTEGGLSSETDGTPRYEWQIYSSFFKQVFFGRRPE